MRGYDLCSSSRSDPVGVPRPSGWEGWGSSSYAERAQAVLRTGASALRDLQLLSPAAAARNCAGAESFRQDAGRSAGALWLSGCGLCSHARARASRIAGSASRREGRRRDSETRNSKIASWRGRKRPHPSNCEGRGTPYKAGKNLETRKEKPKQGSEHTSMAHPAC